MPAASSSEQSPDARDTVDRILSEAVKLRASDIHIEPTAQGYEVRYRVDGLLQTALKLESPAGRSVVGRLMVLAQLLTYRLDVPQEGRLEVTIPGAGSLQTRLAIMPTTHGLRAAVRMPAELVQPQDLDALGLPEGVLRGLKRFASTDAGMLAVTGPAGSGKTTTIYALLRHIVQTSPGVSVISLEDPVERDVPGVTQIEVKPFGELTYERSLRSILRQDPQVLALGEIRDAATASLALQAALSGHRLICTLHAASAGGAVARLFEMGMEPYQITSSLFAVVAQRLLRKTAVGGGHHGRVPVAEIGMMDEPLRRAVLERADAATLGKIIAGQAGYRPMRGAADDLVARGITDAEEVARVLGES
ncbi:MAG TPA: ATPase, T2SS/T4P/T4SS family [Tepidisphaeraceae bacterium]|jgi:type II secretory ATPase GspE/PulE/Tfp pilus assembly ATPase PilB-like protein|nr:ATPase, T2SS/T4P/T4SS family [Tepidisphaeraceae bacterium]